MHIHTSRSTSGIRRAARIASALSLTALLATACGQEPAASESPEATPSAPATPEVGSGDASTTYPGPGPEGGRVATASGLSFWVPNEWVPEEPQSSMRVAQFRIPGPGGDASLVMFAFPGGGSAQANVARWVQQIEQPDGTPSVEIAKTQQQERGGLVLTRLDVSGRFVGQDMPNAPPQPAIDSARLLALVVEGAGNPRFFKLTGPSATVDLEMERWERFLDSVTLDETP
jgi:hypothetical protein